MSCLALWPFSSEYFLRNWDVLGGGHFIEVATGINVALISWQAFRERVQSAERRLEAKINSVAASAEDIDQDRYRGLIYEVLLPVLRMRTWGSCFVYALAIVAAIAGGALLYFGKSSPYVLWFLLPTALQLVVSWFTLGFMIFWMWLMRKGLRFFGPTIPSPKEATAEVKTFLREAKNKLPRRE